MSKPAVPFGNKPLSPCFNLVLLSMFKLGQFNVLAAKVGISGFVLGRSAFLQGTSDAREKEFLWPPAPYHRNSEIPPGHVAFAFLKRL